MRLRAIIARLTRRISSSDFPLNITPATTSIHPPLNGEALIRCPRCPRRPRRGPDAAHAASYEDGHRARPTHDPRAPRAENARYRPRVAVGVHARPARLHALHGAGHARPGLARRHHAL